MAYKELPDYSKLVQMVAALLRQNEQLSAELALTKGVLRRSQDLLLENLGFIQRISTISDAASIVADGEIDAATEVFQRLNSLPFSEDTLTLETAVKVAAVSSVGVFDAEAFVQSNFFENLDRFLPGARIAKANKIAGHHPDGFVDYLGFVCPVEVKRMNFSKRSLDQLLRYMRVYRSRRGIAVAPRLTVRLPPNIFYVQCSYSERAG